MHCRSCTSGILAPLTRGLCLSPNFSLHDIMQESILILGVDSRVHTKGEPHGYYHSFTLPGCSRHHRDHGLDNEYGDGDVALPRGSNMELPMAVAQLAFVADLRYCHLFLHGNDRQLWHPRSTLGMALSDYRMQDRHLVVALRY